MPELTLDLDRDTRLELVDPQHVPEFLALVDTCRPYLREWLGWVDHMKTAADLGRFVDGTLREFAVGKAVALWIRHQGRLAGIIHLRDIEPVNRKAMIGYWVGEQFRGRGLAKKATRAMCAHAFETRGLNRIEIRCATGNTASQAVPVALGFEREGVLRENEWLYDHYVDHVVFSMLRRHWRS